MFRKFIFRILDCLLKLDKVFLKKKKKRKNPTQFNTLMSWKVKLCAKRQDWIPIALGRESVYIA